MMNKQLSTFRLFLAIFALSLGGFAMGTAEFAIMGLLPEMADDLRVTVPQAGQAVSSYALGVLIGAPLLAILTWRLPKTAILIFLVLVCFVGNVLTSMVQSHTDLRWLRFLCGFPHGIYFGIAALIAASLAPHGQRARYVGFIMIGLTVAAVIGVPVVTWFGQSYGWRGAFQLVAYVDLFVAFLLFVFIPKLPKEKALLKTQFNFLKDKRIWMTLGIGAFGFGGMIGTFAYAKPTVMALAGMPESWIPFLFSAMGCGMLIGSVVGGALADRHIMLSLRNIIFWVISVMITYYFLIDHLYLSFLAVFLLGTYTAFVPTLQVRLIDIAPSESQNLVAALHHSALNTANAIGPFLSGLLISFGYGWKSVILVGIGLALIALVLWTALFYSNNKSHVVLTD